MTRLPHDTERRIAPVARRQLARLSRTSLRHLRDARAVFVVAALGALGCSGPETPGALEVLRPCVSKEGPTEAYCGTLSVYEDRRAQSGRRLALAIVVLPALGNSPRRDPLFFLAGGPGQGAARMARDVRDAFRLALRDRDIVLVDQRGTGHSHPLNCAGDAESLQHVAESDDQAVARLKHCLASYDADVRLYTTPIAMDDLDDVRAYLGYDAINLYGGSYGTRAALVYLRQHGAHVRSVVLDGAAPTNMHLPRFAARDAQRALDKLLDDCQRSTSCGATYPHIKARLHALFARLDAAPAHVRLVHPRTGRAEDVVIDARFVGNILFGSLYSPVTGTIVPMLIERAERNDFQGLLALTLAGDPEQNLSVGMQLSIVCSEDAGHISPTEMREASTSTIFGAHLMSGQAKACAIWPKGSIDATYYEPVRSSVPVLVLSGDLDPVTPPTWGEAVARHLPNARHIVAPATGHGVITTPCGARLVQTFLDRADAKALDATCLEMLRRPPFFVTPAGPDPAPAPAEGSSR